jgi:hypothetical protein
MVGRLQYILLLPLIPESSFHKADIAIGNMKDYIPRYRSGLVDLIYIDF